jgi:small-conductance mechanosensitive channel
MNVYQRASFIILIALLLLTGAGLVVTSEWGHRATSGGNRANSATQTPVDLGQFRTAQALAVLAATPEEQDHARDALRMADHEVDFAFTSALYQAASKAVAPTPEIKEVQERIAKAEKTVADLDEQIARLTNSLVNPAAKPTANSAAKLPAGANQDKQAALNQQLDLAKARQELNQDELADAKQDLERVGGDPQARVQRMIDAYNASEQSSGGQLDLSIVGRQANATQPTSNSFTSRSHAWYSLLKLTLDLSQAAQEAKNSAAKFSVRHDQLEHELEQAQAQQSKKLAGTASLPDQPSPPAAAPNQTREAITTYRSLSVLQRRLAGLDRRIRNLQDLAAAYEQWGVLAAARQRALLHSLFITLTWMLFIALAVIIADYVMDGMFHRLEPDQKRLLTLSAVAHITARAIGVVLILLLIFGPPNQTATVIALAGAGLTVVLKDFIVGFFGWFVLMGKNGIRQGDWVEINGVSGEVVEIGLFRTVLLESGNWNESGHPTGRRVAFVNSFAIEGHYFNFSTHGQWLWDELQVALPADQDPTPVAEEIRKLVTKETEANVRLAEQEWSHKGTGQTGNLFSAAPAISVRPANLGFEISVRYVTRASERLQQRSKIYYDLVEVLRRKNMPQAAAVSPGAPAPASV